MENSKPKILIGFSQEQQKYAVSLSEIISEWAKPDLWNEVFKSGQSPLSLFESRLPDYDTCIFLIAKEDIIKICDNEIENSNGMVFNILLSYAFVGRKRTLFVLQRFHTPVLDLLRAMWSFTYDFHKSIEGLAFEVKIRCDDEAVADAPPQNKVRQTVKMLRSGKTGDEEKVESEPISAEFALADPPPEEEVEITVLDKYQYPDINGEQYEFALVMKGEDILISDQGKTIERLDQLFELSEPDVIKNLVAIIKQCGAIKQGKEIVIKIEEWNGNTNEEENEALKKARLALFGCVSFMLNMKIFYV